MAILADDSHRRWAMLLKVISIIVGTLLLPYKIDAQTQSQPPNRAATQRTLSERRAVMVPAAILKQHVGLYELGVLGTVAITLEGNQLMMQFTGQPKLPLFAETENRFFLKVGAAQVTFVKDSTGAAKHITLHLAYMTFPTMHSAYMTFHGTRAQR